MNRYRTSACECGDGETGITLLEMLITLALLSLLTVGLFGSIHLGNRVWQDTDDRAGATDTIRSAQAHLSRLIASAYPKLTAADAIHPTIAFDGETAKIKFLAPDERIKGSLAETTISVVPSVYGLSISYSQELELRNASSGTTRQQSLAEGLAAFQVDYFGMPTRGRKVGWYETWRGATRLPSLVRFRGQFSDRRLKWPELVVATRIVAAITCRYDSASHFCQGR